MLRDVLARAEMGRRKVERRRPAGRCRSVRSRRVSGHQLLPDPVNALVRRLVNVDAAQLIESEESRPSVIAQALKNFVERGKAISKAIPRPQVAYAV